MQRYKISLRKKRISAYFFIKTIRTRVHIIGAVGISFPLRAADFQFLPTELHANVTNLGGYGVSP